jgi:putative ABC transport system ATP-binding protein
VLGQELHQAAPRFLVPLRRQIGFIFQTHNLLDFLTVRRNVEIVFEAHPEVSAWEARERAEEILQAVGLDRQLNDHPSKMSVGQRQRVAIARALVSRPQLVLADEPTAALDSQSGREVVQLLESLARDQQSAILIVTHDNRVLDLADRIVSMEDGRLQSQQGHAMHAAAIGTDQPRFRRF